MDTAEGQQLYLDFEGTPIHAVLHRPASQATGTGVLFVSPFGWEDTCSYRSRRAWAIELAGDGFAALRFDLPGTGDSGGDPNDPELAEAWIRSIATAADGLRRLAGCTRVTAIGPGIAGLLACAASHQGAGLDDLVLWGVPSRGRAVVREMRAFAQMIAARLPEAPPLPEGALAVNGYVASAAMVSALSGLDIRDAARPRVTRALLLDRDGLAVDEMVRATLTDDGTDVTIGAGPGYGAMMAAPQLSVPPTAVMATVAQWLQPGDPGPREEGTPAVEAVVAPGVRERIFTVTSGGIRLAGVLAEPIDRAADLCAVMLNAGAIRRTGPNRMWVDTSRRWADLGVASLRLDLAGLGESSGDEQYPMEDGQLYEDRFGQQVTDALDALTAEGMPPRFLLMGLCSGAYWSFKLGQTDDRVAAVAMLNPLALIFDAFMGTVRTSRKLRRLADPETWKLIVRGRISWSSAADIIRSTVRVALAAPRRRGSRAAIDGDQLDGELDRLRDKGVSALMLFTAHEPMRFELERDGRFARLDRWPNITLELLEGSLASHTLQPPHIQEQVSAALDRFLSGLRSGARPT